MTPIQQSPPTASPPAPTILIIGENALDEKATGALSARYTLRITPDIASAGSLIDTEQPALLLLDVDALSGGVEDAVAALDDQGELAGMPAIFLASNELEEMDPDNVLTRPFTPRELVTCIDAHLRLARLRLEMNQALSRSEARYRAIVEGQSEMVSRFRPDGTLLFVNGAYARARDATPEELMQANFWDWIDEEDHDAVRQLLARITPQSPEIRIENRFETADGVRWILWANRGLAFDENGQPTELQSAGIDITDRKLAEEALRESEARFRLMADAAPVLIWISDAQKRVTWVNERWLQFIGRSMEQELGFGWVENVHPDDHSASSDTFARKFEERQPFSVEYRLRRHDGEYRWILDNGIPLYTTDGAFKGYIGSCIDITDRKMAEQALRQLNETLEDRVEKRTRQVRQLLARLTMAEQEQRRNVSQILHDDLQQLLYGIEMKMAIIETDLRVSEQDHLLSEVEEARAWINQAINTTRRLTVDLSPPILKDEGLADALEWLRSQMYELHGLQIELQAEHSFYLPDQDMRVLLFHVVRELLFNVKKHAAVVRATVSLREEDDELVIEVSDDGRGFDTAGLGQRSLQDRGFGLFSIRERLKLLGGKLQVVSAPDEGTRVIARVPVQP